MHIVRKSKNKSTNKKMGDHSKQTTLRIIRGLQYSFRKTAVGGTAVPLQEVVY